MMGRVDASVGRHDVSCWHEREVFPCPLSHRSWSISGRNADIGESTLLTRGAEVGLAGPRAAG
jgi:hypothetical protein